ncbi:MAG: aldolase/citrate lyase family protein [Clostridia bacterium]|nr:aldolase/citrate lyase family protein [Clostridia bacterium]
MINLKQKLQKKELTIGSWISIGHPNVAEIMAQSGFEWLTIDLEHSAISISQAQELIRVIELSDVVPLVRIGENDPTIIKRVMDAGAHGIIVPMVNSKEEAEAAVSAMRYPPVGKRGVGLSRAQKYGYGFDDYRKWVENDSVLVVQIEHINAVENLEGILRTPGIDAFMVGPYDLSGSLGIPGDFTHPKMIEALNEIKRISEKMNATSGFHVVFPQKESVNQKIKDGYSFIAYGVDFIYIGDSCRRALKEIDGNRFAEA